MMPPHTPTVKPEYAYLATKVQDLMMAKQQAEDDFVTMTQAIEVIGDLIGASEIGITRVDAGKLAVLINHLAKEQYKAFEAFKSL